MPQDARLLPPPIAQSRAVRFCPLIDSRASLSEQECILFTKP